MALSFSKGIVMTVYLASKTMKAINDAIEADQGSQYRKWLGIVLPTISDAYDPRNGRRSHLGVSGIGHPCVRKLFLDYRWATKVSNGGRLIRLFNRGHLEEGRFIAALLTAGLQVYQQDAEGKQFRISELGGHFGSAIDGIVIGCPDMPNPNEPILCEMKTHGEKSFKKLVAEGVKESKPIHYVQIQVYMSKMGLGACLYVAVNKNTDDLYCELVPYDPVTADQFIDRGHRVVLADDLPVGLSTKGVSWFECKHCNKAGICYRGEMPEKNCRTCSYSQALENGTWFCRNTSIAKTITTDDQIAACPHYKVAPYYGK